MWAISTAGHVLAGESSLQAGIRELKEELNLDVQEQELEYLFTLKEANRNVSIRLMCLMMFIFFIVI